MSSCVNLQLQCLGYPLLVMPGHGIVMAIYGMEDVLRERVFFCTVRLYILY